MCLDSTWITPKWICDAYEDCLGGEDEINCTITKYAEASNYK